MHVIPFDEKSFAEALANKHSDAEVIKNKAHFAYFLSYLGDDGISARTMVIEDKYISKDYLHDYASYYAFCFEDYEKVCRRIHFFSSAFSEAELNAALLNPEELKFWDSYLGFIVRKPLPVTVIGYTLLTVYPENDNAKRIYSALRDYKVHFFGKELSIRSLAFQEQDSVIAACATTAIWCMLNRASTDLHTTLKVPSEITKGAGLAHQGGRMFPNSGLEIRQICKAIISCGLESEVNQGSVHVNIADRHPIPVISTNRLKQLIYAYERIGIPIILCIQVPSGKDYGYHAVAVAGFKMQEYQLNSIASAEPAIAADEPIHEVAIAEVEEADVKETNLKEADVEEEDVPEANPECIADHMEKFYVHDDQFGPFAWVKFLENDGLESPWTTNDEDKRATYVINAVVPVYPKIRITYENIYALVVPLEKIIKRIFQLVGIEHVPVRWDIKLDFSECFKRYVMASELEDDVKLNLAKKSMPKYIWVVKCYVTDFRFLELTFDATGVNNAMLGLHLISYAEKEVNSLMYQYIVDWKEGLAAIFETAGGSKYVEHLLEHLKEWK